MGILAVILSIIALLCGILLTFMLGTTGLIITLVLAAAAIVLAIVKRTRDKKGGIPAIVIGILAILIGFGVNAFWGTVFESLHERAEEYMPNGLWAQVSEDYTHGVMGIIKNMPQDEADLNKVLEEMNQLAKMEDKED